MKTQNLPNGSPLETKKQYFTKLYKLSTLAYITDNTELHVTLEYNELALKHLNNDEMTRKIQMY